MYIELQLVVSYKTKQSPEKYPNLFVGKINYQAHIIRFVNKIRWLFWFIQYFFDDILHRSATFSGKRPSLPYDTLPYGTRYCSLWWMEVQKVIITVTWYRTVPYRTVLVLFEGYCTVLKFHDIIILFEFHSLYRYMYLPMYVDRSLESKILE